MVLNANSKTFVLHLAIQMQKEMPVHLKRQAQIQNKAQVGTLIFDKALTIIPTEYFNYSNIFSKSIQRNFQNTLK